MKSSFLRISAVSLAVLPSPLSTTAMKVVDGLGAPSRLCRLKSSYQRFRPNPPPLGRSLLGRSVLGRASLTFNGRPSNFQPFKAAIAFTASAWSLISTNPKFLGCPVSRSVTILTRSTVPYFSKSERSMSSVAVKLRFPTEMFFIRLVFPQPTCNNNRRSHPATQYSGNKCQGDCFGGSHCGNLSQINITFGLAWHVFEPFYRL